MDYLVHSLLAPYEGQMWQADHLNPILRKGADFIVNLETLETNPNKPFETYVFADYHLTQAQFDGFLYQLRKLKGNHVLGHPNIRGHAEVLRGDLEFQFLVVHTHNQEEIIVYYPRQDFAADELLFPLIPLLPPQDRYVLLPIGGDPFIKQQTLEAWIDRLLSLSKQDLSAYIHTTQ
ncbi:hypothetical protein [Saccharibacillus sacchari]|uniref:hypothetical protein n=1 Tax=Saccharibacillus sacchari TaxID=456493 RepID=UPI000684AF45|nr:hypothetical protein [Saccharibacillus sacchari]